MTANPLIICATTRLARGMQLREQLTQTARGKGVWQAANATTLSQWLSTLLNNAILAAHVPVSAMPWQKLNGFSETHFWQLAIESCLAKHESAALFDVKALAKSAMQANQTMIEWQISEAQLNSDYLQPETRQFMRWRNTFYALCAQKNVLDAMEYEAKQIALIAEYALPLPAEIVFAGFDRITPLLQSLIDICIQKGVTVRFEKAHDVPASNTMPYKIALQDHQAECEAAVAWAQQKLQENPNAQLAILSPVLGQVQRQLTDLLDATFHPTSLAPQQAEAPRCYDTALGNALAEYPMVRSALQLLRTATQKSALHFEDMTALLQDHYWGDSTTFSYRAQLDFKARRSLTAHYTLAGFVAFATAPKVARFSEANVQSIAEYEAQLADENIAQTATHAHLKQILLTQQQWAQPPKNRSTSDWVAQFLALLTQLNWAKTRSLSSAEYQTQQKFLQALQSLEALYDLLGNVTAQEALSHLLAICQANMFQPEAAGNTHIQLLGLLETPALTLDAAWIMQMNDQHWPPAVALNPLLPVKLQRDLNLPNASALVQTQFANTIQARLMRMANTVVFSYAHQNQDRELRASPVLGSYDLPAESTVLAMPEAMQAALHLTIQANKAQFVAPKPLETFADSIAPSVLLDSPMRGGTKLLATQAICPAWAFYAYRLGAKKLETPTDGLNSMTRGRLLHAVLQHFWQQQHSLQQLNDLTEAEKVAAIDVAIEAGINMLDLRAQHTVPSQVLRLESLRIARIVQQLLSLETQRADFTVEACEKPYEIDIAGLNLHLTIDRIDRLNADEGDGALVVIDYKTSANVKIAPWAATRMTEPQLPIYAVLALESQPVAALSFVKLRTNEVAFIGLAKDVDLLPQVSTVADTKANVFHQFATWEDLFTHWHKALHAIAHEVQQGVASVTFTKETDLAYCDVLPLLRLPERLMQFEQKNLNQVNLERAQRTSPGFINPDFINLGLIANE